MLALSVNTTTNTQDPHSSTADLINQNGHRDGSTSPPAPSYSPITPTMSPTTLPTSNGVDQHAAPPNISQPVQPLIPFSESDNSDAIALRSAISILQIQRQQSLVHLKSLERQKQAAVTDPVNFAKDVVAGRVKVVANGELLSSQGPEAESADDADEVTSLDAELLGEKPSKFENPPAPQNVVRCPPINWAKYHIVGEPLEKLHDQQRMRPSPGQIQRDEEREMAKECFVAKPFDPWSDRLGDPGVRTRSLARKDV